MQCSQPCLATAPDSSPFKCRLEVGTESALDRSKSVKSFLMQIFAASGNTDIQVEPLRPAANRAWCAPSLPTTGCVAMPRRVSTA